MMRMLMLTAVMLLCGCGRGEKFVEVSGKIWVGTTPLTNGQVGFIPDETADNKHYEYAVGEIQSDGTYRLATNSTAGVRPGWYKVVVWSASEPIPAIPVFDASGHPKPIAWRVATKYTKRETTDVRREVVENPGPGAYDLKFGPP